MENIQNITLKLEVTIASEVNFTRLAPDAQLNVKLLY